MFKGVSLNVNNSHKNKMVSENNPENRINKFLTISHILSSN